MFIMQGQSFYKKKYFGRFKAYDIAKKHDINFDLQYLGVLHIADKTDDIFEIMRKFEVRNLCCRAKILILKFELLLPDLDLTSKVGKL